MLAMRSQVMARSFTMRRSFCRFTIQYSTHKIEDVCFVPPEYGASVSSPHHFVALLIPLPVPLPVLLLIPLLVPLPVPSRSVLCLKTAFHDPG